MKTEEIIEQIKALREKNIKKGYDLNHNKKYDKTELLFASVALIGAAYSQLRGLGIESDASQFWPFGDFKPNVDPKKNLLDACQFIISEIERM